MPKLGRTGGENRITKSLASFEESRANLWSGIFKDQPLIGAAVERTTRNPPLMSAAVIAPEQGAK
jgi:hypothetical protein